MKEYKWKFIFSKTFHFDAHPSIIAAIKRAKAAANKKGSPVIIQQWNPKSAIKYIVKPYKLKVLSKTGLINWYGDKGIDIKYIKNSNYKLKL